jgi:PTH2 family peptidyl-tRNA hydrolase
MKEAKQVIVMRKDLNMRKGKMVSQGAHASLGAVLAMMSREETTRESGGIPWEMVEYKVRALKNSPLEQWISGIFTKITVGVDSLEELEMIYNKAKEAGIPTVMITDAGFTEFKGVPTVTCIAVGPYWSEKIDSITGHLKLL